MAEGQLIADAPKLARHPRGHRAGPLRRLHPRAHRVGPGTGPGPKRSFAMVGDAGHAFDEPGILDALIRATDTFA
ncbi:hypothetical protein ACU686_21030 [Yinghuangia aomiensis]